jgi:uncharacterized membrane protein
LAVGACDGLTFTGSYVLTQADIDAGEYENIALATGTPPMGPNVTDDSDDPNDSTDDDPDGDGDPDDPTITDLPQDPRIELEKVGVWNDGNADGNADVGETISYTFEVCNTGNVTLTNVTVTDPLVTVVGGPIPTLAVGACDGVTFTGSYVLTQADIDAGEYENIALATGTPPIGPNVTDDSDDPNDLTNDDPDGDGDPDDPTITDLPQDPRIELEKVGVWNDGNGDGNADVGETISYTFEVCNTGNVTLTNVTVTDPLVTVVGGPIPTLAVGACDGVTFTGSYVLTQADIDAGEYENIALATGTPPIGPNVTDDSDDPNDPTNDDPDGDGDPDDPTITDLPQDPRIELEKVGVWNDGNADGNADVGETISYTFEVCNTGNVTLTNVTVTDPLVTVVGGPIPTLAVGACDGLAFTGSYVLTQADIDAGEYENIALATGTPPMGPNVTDDSDDPNDLTNDDPDGDGDPDDPTITDLPQDPRIELEKVGVWNDGNADGNADVGETISYTFEVCNTGNVTLTNVTVTDPLVTVVGGPIPTLAVGACDGLTFTGSYVLTQADIDAGEYENIALATGTPPMGPNVTDDSDDPNDSTDDDPDGDGDPDDPTITDLPQDPRIELEKVGVWNDGNADGNADVGETISYTFEVCNTGNVTLTNVTVTDPLVTVVGGPIPTLAVGACDGLTFTGSYVLTQADIDAGEYENIALATGTPPMGPNVTDDSDDPNDSTDDDPDGDGDPDDPTITDLPQDPRIELEKVGVWNDGNGDGNADVGETISYTFEVCNTGNVTLTNVTVTDPLVTVVGGPIPTLAVGACDGLTFTGSYVLTQADIDAGEYENIALATGTPPMGPNVTDDSDDPNDSTDDDPDGDGDPDDPTITDLPQDPRIELEKVGVWNDGNGDGNADVGETISYTFEVCNTGNVTLTNVTVTDPLVTVVGGPIPTLAVGACDGLTFTGSYVLTQADIDAGEYENIALATGTPPMGPNVTDDSDDPNDSTDDDPDGDGDPDDPTITDLPQDPRIELEKVGVWNDGNGDGNADVGETISYTFEVCNTGNVTLTNVTVTDPLVTVVGGPIPTLAVGACDNLTFTGSYVLTQADIDAGEYENIALATGTPPMGPNVTDDSDDPNDSTDDDPDGDGDPDDPTITDLPQDPRIELEKVGVWNDGNGDGNADVGETISYTFEVCNTGNVTLTNVTVTDPLVTVVGGPIPTLAVGACDGVTFTGSYVLTQADIDAGEYENIALATGTPPMGPNVTDDSDDPNDLTNDDPDGDGDPDDPTITDLPQDPRIELEKVGVWNDGNADGNADVGETISYTFEVCNTGNVTLTNVTVTDPLVTVVGGPIPTLAVGACDGLTFTGSYVLTQADIDAGEYENIALATGTPPMGPNVTDDSDDPNDLTDDDPDGDGDPDDPTITDLPQDPRIELEKVGVWNDGNGDGNADVGETISYTFEVCNTGNVTLTNVTVTDPLVTVVGGPIPTLAVGACDGLAFTGSYVLTQADIDAGEYENIALATGTPPIGPNVTDDSDDPNDLTNDDPDGDGDPDDPTITDLPQDPRIELEKVGVWNDGNADGNADVGETISYTFEVCNTGNVTLTNVTVTDPLVTVVGGPIPTLAVGACDGVTFTGSYVLTQADIDAGEYENIALATGTPPMGPNVTDDSDDPNDLTDTDPDGDGDPDDPTITDLPQDPRIELEKVGVWNDGNGDGNADVGETISYTFEVCNTGNVTLTNVTVTDPLVTVVGGPIPTLAVGACDGVTFTGSYVLTQADIDAGEYENIALATGTPPIGPNVTDDSDDPNDPTNDDPDGDGDPDDPTITDLPQDPRIELEKVGVWNDGNADGNADVGETISYTFEVCNTGNVTLTNVTVTDPLVTVVGGPIPTLAVGACDGLTFTGSYVLTQADIDAGEYENIALATGTPPMGPNVTDDSDDPNDSTDDDPDGDGDPDDPTITDLPQDPRIELEKVGVWNDGNGDGNADVGETISYTFEVCNTGNVTLTNVTVTDPLVTVVGGPIPTLAVGACDGVTFTGSYVLTQADIDAGEYENIALATGTPPIGPNVTDDSDDPNDLTNDDPDGDGDPDDPTITDLPQDPQIGMAKEIVTTVNNFDGTFTSTFSLVMTNNGNVTLGDLQFDDDLSTEFGTYAVGVPGIPGQYAISNISIVRNSANPVSLNASFDGMSDTEMLDVSLGGSMPPGDTVRISLSVRFRPNKYVYMNQAFGVGDLPANDDPLGFPDLDPSDADDSSDSGSNSSDDPMSGGDNPGEPGDSGTTDDPTEIMLPVGRITGTGWDDLDADGIQDPGEPGIAGLIVHLYRCDGFLIGLDTTDASGNYAFEFVPPGNYFTWFLPSSFPAGYLATLQNQGGDEDLDSDIDVSGVAFPCVVLNIGDEIDHVDAGLTESASIGDLVWHDRNGNGLQDSGEEGIGGIPVSVVDPVTNFVIQSVTTAANGSFLFSKLFPKSYYLRFSVPASWVVTTPNNGPDFKDSDVDNSNGAGTTQTTLLSPGEDDRTWDLGLYKCAMIGGDVWFDIDLDGVYDRAEKGINGLNVAIVDALTGQTVTTLRTDAKPGTPSDDGYYKAPCLRPGKYFVRFERPGHLGAAEPYLGGDPNRDCDITHDNGVNTSPVIMVSSGDMVLNIGAGFQVKAMAGDFVWHDSNYNGLQDAGEAPASNVKVSAYRQSGSMVSQAVTDYGGRFTLDGLVQGDYYMKFEPAVNQGFTISNAGDPNLDSDVDNTFGYGTTKLIRIMAGEVRPSIDAGLVSKALAISWLDFRGEYNGEFTQLDWATGVEVDNDHFDVERRHESELDFVTLGSVAAHPHGNMTRHDYSYEDRGMNRPGTYYYRVKQIDQSGIASYSRIIAVHVEAGLSLQAFLSPNPVSDVLTMDLWIPRDGEVSMSVVDQSGRKMSTIHSNTWMQRGHHTLRIEAGELASGHYAIQLVANGNLIVQKFVVVR